MDGFLLLICSPMLIHVDIHVRKDASALPGTLM